MPPRKSQSPSAAGINSANNNAKDADASKRKQLPPYTAEEKTLLANLHAALSKGPSKDVAALSKDSWPATAPILAGAVEKILRMAAEQYQAAQAAAAQKEGGISRPSTTTGTSGTAAAGNSSTAVPSSVGQQPLSGPAGTPAQFVEENAYIVEQLKLLPHTPFTIQRLVELLQDPYGPHTAAKDGKQRGDALQASLRRCILVTYPIAGSPEDA